MRQAEWNPMKELARVQEQMNRLFDRTLARANFDPREGVGAWTPAADVFETDSSLVFCLELPGLEQKDIELRVEGDELVVEGERRMEREAVGSEQFHRVERAYGKFVRRFPLPSTTNRESVQASYREGVLRVALDKTAGRRPGSIRVDIR